MLYLSNDLKRYDDGELLIRCTLGDHEEEEEMLRTLSKFHTNIRGKSESCTHGECQLVK